MIRTVPVEFGANGLKYRQVTRAGQVAVYSVQSKAGKIYGFEVVMLKIAPACTFMGEFFPDREVYPSNQDFGSTGWYFPSRKDSERLFQELCKRPKQPPLSQNLAVLKVST